MKRFYLFALVAMVFAACTTDETQDVQLADVPETLTVSFEEDTRIQLNEAQKTVWSKDDLVSVFYKSDANDCWKFTGDTGDRTATLQRVSKGEGTRRGDNVIVVYPYRSDYLVSLSSNSIEAYLPETQTYCEGSYGVGSSPMVGFGDYKQFVLKNVCGWLKLQLTGNGERVHSITLKGNNGEQVAGDILIVAEDSSTILASASVDVDDSEVGGSLLLEDDILTEVTLDCGNGVELGAEATAFYIALPPQTFEKGLTVEIESTEGKIMTKSTENSIAIERNTIQPMASVEYEMDVVPLNEIWYTATAKVVPYRPDEFGTTITSNVWDSESGKGVITFNANVTKIGYYAFYECKKLKTITIPDSVNEIRDYAFSYCTSLTSVTIPNSVTSIGDYAFSDCNSLTSVNIPDSVTEIGAGAFSYCTSLKTFYGKFASEDNRCLIVDGVLNSFAIGCGATSYTIPDSVTSIGFQAFRWCTSLTSVNIPDSVTSIGNYAFSYCTSLKAFYGKFASEDNRCLIVNGVLNSFAIGCGATSYNIPDSVTRIGVSAFSSCTSLTSVTIPDSVTSIGSNAFDGCSSLASITIPDSVTSIGWDAFSGCKSLTSVTIGNSVTSIGDNAFEGCTSLKEVYCKATTPPTGHSNMFSSNATGRRIFVPASDDDSIINAYKAKQYWSDYASYIEEYDFSAEQ